MRSVAPGPTPARSRGPRRGRTALRSTRAGSACSQAASRAIPGAWVSSLAWCSPGRGRQSRAVHHRVGTRVGTKVGSAMHPASPHGNGCRRSGQTASDRQTSTAGRRFQGLQPARAAGGLKNDYPGKCGAFLQGTPVHFKVQGLRTSRWMRHAPQTHLGFAWVLQVPDAPVGRAPLPPGGTGPSSRIGCCASMRGDKAHGRLEGGRRWLGYVMTPHSGGVHRRQGCTSAAQATSKGPMNGSTGKGLHRGLRGTARELLETLEILERSRGRCGSRPLTAA